MTTLPTIITRPHAAHGTRSPADIGSATTQPVARVIWRVLHREVDRTRPRGGRVGNTRVEARLSDTTITLRRFDREREISTVILPARTRVTETPAGTLHEWTLLDGGAPGPALRLLLGEGVRAAVAGGIYSAAAISVPCLMARLASSSVATSAPPIRCIGLVNSAVSSRNGS